MRRLNGQQEFVNISVGGKGGKEEFGSTLQAHA
jgi:hypothetical protein